MLPPLVLLNISATKNNVPVNTKTISLMKPKYLKKKAITKVTNEEAMNASLLFEELIRKAEPPPKIKRKAKPIMP